MDQLKKKIRHVPDFPKAGILFYDITTLLRDAAGFRTAIDSLIVPFKNSDVDLVVGMESRGFIFGAVVADRLGAGFVPVLIVDDLLATGGTAKATLDLVKGSGGTVVGLSFLIELIGLDGRSRLIGENVHAVLKY